jgi:hypothetical protein
MQSKFGIMKSFLLHINKRVAEWIMPEIRIEILYTEYIYKKEEWIKESLFSKDGVFSMMIIFLLSLRF